MKTIKPLQFLIFTIYTIFVLTLSFDSLDASRKFRLFEYDKYIHFTEYLLFGMLFLNSIKLNSIKKTAEYASATAAIALKSKNTISDDLSAKNIELILKENKIETK